jgi:hypothetical protein
MYAVHNGCDRFITVDRNFLYARRGLKIATPVELATELNLKSQTRDSAAEIGKGTA